MQCVTPMFRIYNPNNPKDTGKIISRQKAMQMLEKNPNYLRNWNDDRPWNNGFTAIQKVPCKKCWACQLNYSAEWATRIMLEASEHECNYWLTLTYDDLHLPITEKIEVTKNEIYENDGTWTEGTLYKKDIEKFLNSLRKYFERKNHKGIKYFYAGEYGEENGRPHFHIVLMNCPLDPLQFYGAKVDGKFYKAHWKSKEIERFWKEGFSEVCELEWSDAAYTARYCTKKISFDTDKTIYYKQGKMPEFVRMSKGIGFDYFRKNKDEIYKTDSIVMKTVKGNTGANKPPKAFDRQLEKNNPELLEIIKESRKKSAERADKLIKELSDYTDLDNLIMAAERVKTKMQMLPRVGEC